MAGRSSKRGATVAYMETADDEDNIQPGTRISAASSVALSPMKEKSNVSKVRTEKLRRLPSSSTADTVSSAPPGILKRESRPRTKERSSTKEKEKRSSSKRPPEARPSARHANTTTAVPTTSSRRHSQVPNEAAYYGQLPEIQRPRAPSYQSARPPSASARFQPPIERTRTPARESWAMPPPPPPGAYGLQYPMGPPPPPRQDHGYFPHVEARSVPGDAHGLASRFSRGAPLERTPSLEHRSATPSAYIPDYDQYDYDPEPMISRRRSVSRRPTLEESRPPRPLRRASTAAPTQMHPFGLPPASPTKSRRVSQRPKSGVYGTELADLLAGVSLADVEPDLALARAKRPTLDLSYSYGDQIMNVASTRNRPTSQYGRTYSDETDELSDRLHQATSYQNEVNGDFSIPLTAETLRKATKAGTQTSTRSSGSRDESEYNKRSATTRTSLDNDDMEFTVNGDATVTVGKATIQCREGANISIKARAGTSGGHVRSSGLSEQAASLYEERLFARHDRPLTRTRDRSQSGSISRTYDYGPPVTANWSNNYPYASNYI